ncbi:hypothetical protein RND81_01G096000 [Saponaria officinalis]|uniref:Secreted protein n=1 Tax=Saponaria officinalis TaxID=3572 RepID=A0AAW1NDT7_SAPOF
MHAASCLLQLQLLVVSRACPGAAISDCYLWVPLPAAAVVPRSLASHGWRQSVRLYLYQATTLSL